MLPIALPFMRVRRRSLVSSRIVRSSLWLAALAATAWVTYGSLLDLDFLGWDTLPLILTSRVETLSDVLHSFTTELMAGRYPLGAFYRPFSTLTLAADWAVWGLDPTGYYLSDLVAMLGAAVGVGLVAQRLFGSRLLSFIASFSFVLHPAHFEALPVPARRPDYLSLLFTLLAIWALPKAGERALGRRASVCAAFVLCALTAKETGVVALGLLFVVALSETAGRLSERSRDALRRTALCFGALALFLAARTWVLGGLGGHQNTGVVKAIGRLPGVLRMYGTLVLLPQPLTATARFSAVFTVVAALALVVGLAILILDRRANTVGGLGRRIQGLGVCAVWLAGLTFVTAVSGDRQPWYVVPFLPIHSLLFAAVATGAIRALAGREWRVGMQIAGIAVLLAVCHLRYSGVFHDYVEWQEISRSTHQFLERTRRETEGLGPGQVLLLRGLPERLSVPPGLVGARAAAGLTYYSVQAWAELALPGRPLRVVYAQPDLDRLARPDAIVVAVTPTP